MSERALARPDQTPPALRGVTAPAVRVETQSIDLFVLCDNLAKSGYFQDAKQGAQAVVKVLYGQELVISPVNAMMGIHIISGRPCPSANLIATLIKKSGRYDYQVKRLDNQGCALEVLQLRAGQWCVVGESSFTLEDAKQAGLTTGANKHNWANYPRNMCFARAISNLARFYCADVFGGAPVYTPDELGEVVDGESGDLLPTAAPARGEVTDVSDRVRGAAERQPSYAAATVETNGQQKALDVPQDPRKVCEAHVKELGWQGQMKPRFEQALGKTLTCKLSEAPASFWADLEPVLRQAVSDKKRAYAIYAKWCALMGLDEKNREERLRNWTPLCGRDDLTSSADLSPAEWATLADALHLAEKQERIAQELAGDPHGHERRYDDPAENEG